MSNLSVEELNREYSLGRYLNFREGQNGFIYTHINNDSGSAQIFLHGAHVTSFIPMGKVPVIYLSSESLYANGKALRGGIPISWPWFADHPSDNTKPAHGFARNSLWDVKQTKYISSDETEITFVLNESDQTHKLWDYSFDLTLTVCVGTELNSLLKMTNCGDESFRITSAFHSYYYVGDIHSVNVYGLEDAEYIDKVDSYKTKKQNGPIAIKGETDRIYINTQNECRIEDRELNRIIRISKSGSRSTVVWNPWSEKTQKMSDLSDDAYSRFLCVETANAGPDEVVLAPGDQHILSLNVTVENI